MLLLSAKEAISKYLFNTDSVAADDSLERQAI